MSLPRLASSLVLTAAALGVVVAPADAARRRPPAPEAMGHLTWASPQSDPIALSPDGALLYVANTTSNTVDVISTASNAVIATVEVGMEPVSVAVRPDGNEVWVANHVSDSVSVIDTGSSGSSSFRRVVETIQDLDANGVTQFDEPVGIAFASNSKAYVALSSRNQIAVVDATNYTVTNRLQLTAQEPRAIAVRGGRLFVAAFESFNQTQASFCTQPSSLPGTFPSGNEIVGDPCSLGLVELATFVTQPNLPDAVKNIVIDTQLPDRDLFVYRTDTDQLIEAVSGMGTLLYGIAVDSSQNVYVTQADARNAENGDHGEFLVGLDNRMFLNRIAEVACGGSNNNPCDNIPTQHDLEPTPPAQPSAGNELATPFGISVSDDDATLLVTAAGTSRLFTVAASAPDTPLDILDLDDPGVSGDEGQQIPRGVALDSSAGKAYVLNTLDNSVTVVDVDLDPLSGTYGALTHVTEIPVGSDPTPDAVRRGRIAFNNAFASDSGTFSCGSCHPDGNTDQLLWRIGGECPGLGCDPGDEPRTTMPIRGLRDAIPLHWDGTLGDPFGGTNGSGSTGSNCTLGAGGDQKPCFRQLVDASLQGVMCDQTGTCDPGGSQLSEQEKDDMAVFLERVAYPPARSRRMSDVLSNPGSSVTITDLQGGNGESADARTGFEDFFFDRNNTPPNSGNPDTCADSNAGCHELPLLAGTNAEILTGFDAPTMRGMTDRYVQFSLGSTAPREVLEQANAGISFFNLQAGPLEPAIAWSASDGFREITTFGAAFLAFEGVYGPRPLNIFQMFEEASTGHSGALGRQVTLNNTTTASCTPCDVDDLLAALEAADARGVVNLRGSGVRTGQPVQLGYNAATDLYQVGHAQLTRAQIITEAAQMPPNLFATLTAHLRSVVSEDNPQPLIAPLNAQCGTGDGPSGDPNLPAGTSFNLGSAHVAQGDEVFLNGQATGITIGTVNVGGGSCSFGSGEITPDVIAIGGITRTANTDVLQIRSVSSGLLSNEVPLP